MKYTSKQYHRFTFITEESSDFDTANAQRQAELILIQFGSKIFDSEFSTTTVDPTTLKPIK